MDRFQALRVFVRVADLGSFTRAADALELSRARVSEAVAALERELGARLVHRTTRRVSLSDDGRAYYERARQILADLEEADALVLRSSGGSARGRLRIAMPIGLARQFVVPALPRFLARNPELALEVRLENRAVDLVEEGVDCAISYGEPPNDALVARRVVATHLLTCASPAYLARHGAPRTPEELGQHACIAFLALASVRPANWLFRADGQSIAHHPVSALAFNSMEACVEAAEAGLGITQVLSALAHRALQRKQLRRVLAAYAADGPALYLVYPPNRQHSARIRVVLAFLNQVLESAGRL
jgi:LysR family transcriptional regulator for bpeEF and oprC